MKILIIEDEMKTARLLQQYIERLRPATIIYPVIQSIEDAIHFLSTNDCPDLIFMDIQLNDGSSFDIFQEVDIYCPIIFCTAFDEYAVEAFQVNGVAYILKPFDQNSVAKALDKVEQLTSVTQPNDQLKNLQALLSQTLSTSVIKSFLVFHKQKYIPIEISDIAFFHVKNEITFIHTFSGESFVFDQSLNAIEEKLKEVSFYRANRQFLISFQVIQAVENYFTRKLLVHLKITPPEPVIVSRAKATSFMQWLGTR
ncbi:MAG: LytR/AlgR family response regulator transcription factor [Thermonemataceae bacterium]